MKKRDGSVISKIFINTFLTIFSLVCLIPFLIVVSSSFTDEQMIVENGYSILPRNFTLMAYKFILADPTQMVRAYGITIFITIVGTVISLVISSCLAYAISRKDFPHRNKISLYVFFTMLFNGGLVPSYIIVAQVLNLKDTIFALILPYLIMPFYILLLKTYYSDIPFSLVESAKIEGAGEITVLFKIILPLSLPAMATVGLFIVLQYWNDWWLALLYIESAELNPLQYMLYLIMQNLNAMRLSPLQGQLSTTILPGENARMAMAVLAIGPIIFAFMFVQKYFVSGLTVGAVKG